MRPIAVGFSEAVSHLTPFVTVGLALFVLVLLLLVALG